MRLITAKDQETILMAGRITAKIKERMFPGCGVMEIRDILEENGINRHLPIELQSTEIALITPNGILMQTRPTDNDQLGMWGGVLNDGEDPEDGAIREIREEVGIEIEKGKLEFVEINEHSHKYANGDKAIFKSYRYTLKLDYVPDTHLIFGEETKGTVIVAHTIISHQQEFIKRVLGEI